MDIQKQLLKIAKDTMGFPVVFGDMAFINVVMDKLHRAKQFPACVMLQPVSGSFQMGDGVYGANVYNTEHCIVGFTDLVKFDGDPWEAHAKVEGLKDKCVEFLKLVSSSGDFDILEEVSYSVMYDSMDANLVIVLVDFDLKERDGIC